MKSYISPLLILLTVLNLSCGGSDDQPGQPQPPQLVFPENNSECFEGTVSTSDPNISEIVFRWEPAANANSYTISIKNLNNGRSAVSQSTSSTSLSIGLERGVPFSWSVMAIGGESTSPAESETWKFFNAGDGIEAHVPFPADLVYPRSGASIGLNGGNTLELRWEGADVDNDISGYEVFLGTQDPPATQVGSAGSAQSLRVSGLVAGTTYYWRVVTNDRAGNTSTSEVSQFLIVN